jgi:hypothetical protein
MRQILSAVIVCASLGPGLAAQLHAQSLADVARKEEERRKTIPQAAKVYTNKDLSAAPPSSAPPPPAAAATPADAKADKGTAKTPTEKAAEEAAAAKDQAPVKDKAYWAGRVKALQDQLDRNDTYAAALQTRINALTTDFVNRDDPAQRAVLERDRQKNIAELARLKLAIKDDTKALADLAEEARRAGVPPGWLR